MMDGFKLIIREKKNSREIGLNKLILKRVSLVN